MANSKISALPSASTPLAGTEVLPVVQGGITEQVSVANLTAGRAVSASSLALTTALPVTSGGTGTTTAFTAGSVVFAGASGIYSQDNTNFFWDDTNNRLGVGTATPATKFDVSNASGRNVRIGGFQFGGTSATADAGNNVVGSGAYYNGSNLTATATSATTLQYGNGTFFFYADTGLTVGNTFAFTPKFSIAASGNVTVNTGNVVQGTAAKGFDFSANTPLAGKTSTLLNWYEEGTWTPNQGAGLTLVGAFSSTGRYTRIGRQVSIGGTVTGATSVAVTAAGVITSNLPFTVVTAGHGGATNVANNASATVICTSTSVTAASAIAATATITFSATYFV
jgi:hypothetical protein